MGGHGRAACACGPTAATTRPSGSCSRREPGHSRSRDCRPGPCALSGRRSPGFSRRRPELFAPSRLPVFNLVLEGTHYYGFPEFGIPGFKIGLYELGGESGEPDGISREPTLDDELPLRAFAERYFPDGAGPALSLKTCLFEPSPDEHFLIDFHPETPNVVVGAGFSGHGFKFCPVVGEILADLAADGGTRHDIGLFRLDRFAD